MLVSVSGRESPSYTTNASVMQKNSLLVFYSSVCYTTIDVTSLNIQHSSCSFTDPRHGDRKYSFGNLSLVFQSEWFFQDASTVFPSLQVPNDPPHPTSRHQPAIKSKLAPFQIDFLVLLLLLPIVDSIKVTATKTTTWLLELRSTINLSGGLLGSCIF